MVRYFFHGIATSLGQIMYLGSELFAGLDPLPHPSRLFPLDPASGARLAQCDTALVCEDDGEELLIGRFPF